MPKETSNNSDSELKRLRRALADAEQKLSEARAVNDDINRKLQQRQLVSDDYVTEESVRIRVGPFSLHIHPQENRPPEIVISKIGFSPRAVAKDFERFLKGISNAENASSSAASTSDALAVNDAPLPQAQSKGSKSKSR